MSVLKKKLLKELAKIPGLESHPSKVAGGTAIFFGTREIAHFHSDHEIDVRLTKKVIRASGLNHPEDSNFHKKRAKTSDWMELRYFQQSDLDDVVRLFKLALKEYA